MQTKKKHVLIIDWKSLKKSSNLVAVWPGCLTALPGVWLWRRAARVTHPSIGGRRRVDAQCGRALGAFLAPRFWEVFHVKKRHDTWAIMWKKKLTKCQDYTDVSPICVIDTRTTPWRSKRSASVHLRALALWHATTSRPRTSAHPPTRGFRRLVGRGKYESTWNSMLMDYNWLKTSKSTWSHDILVNHNCCQDSKAFWHVLTTYVDSQH